MRAEIEFVLAAGIRTFSFIDPVFNLTRERLEWLAGLLAPHVARGVRLHTVEVDIERIDDGVAELLAACGVASVETGPQTVGERALATCRRTFDEARIPRGSAGAAAPRHLRRDRSHHRAAGRHRRRRTRGMRFALDVDPGAIQMSTLHVLPGTELWQHAEELGLAFDRSPRTKSIATAEIGLRRLRRLEVLGTALQTAYRARLTER